MDTNELTLDKILPSDHKFNDRYESQEYIQALLNIERVSYFMDKLKKSGDFGDIEETDRLKSYINEYMALG